MISNDQKFMRQLSRRLAAVARCDLAAEISAGSRFAKEFPTLSAAVRGRLAFLEKQLESKKT